LYLWERKRKKEGGEGRGKKRGEGGKERVEERERKRGMEAIWSDYTRNIQFL
jgi:hypothetical protein